MDTIKFGLLASWISAFAGRRMDRDTVLDLKDLVDDNESLAPIRPPATVPSHQVDDLLRAVMEDKKIEAIKAYRTITGAGLKESKDAIEMYTVSYADKIKHSQSIRIAAFEDAIAELQNHGSYDAAEILKTFK